MNNASQTTKANNRNKKVLTRNAKQLISSRTLEDSRHQRNAENLNCLIQTHKHLPYAETPKARILEKKNCLHIENLRHAVLVYSSSPHQFVLNDLATLWADLCSLCLQHCRPFIARAANSANELRGRCLQSAWCKRQLSQNIVTLCPCNSPIK